MLFLPIFNDLSHNLPMHVFHIEREKIGFGYGTRVQYANNDANDDANDNNNNAASKQHKCT